MKDTKSNILDFWFVETKPAQWFQKNPDFDALIHDRFAQDFDLALAGIYDSWQDDVKGCLALIVLLDQFSRNMYRDTPAAFSGDARALSVARKVIEKSWDILVPVVQRRFLYLPFEHSENLSDQEKSVALFSGIKKDDPMGYEYAIKHRDVIARFGRFPHRNAILGRTSTAEELSYLAEPGAGF